jgi:hypothetical protein
LGCLCLFAGGCGLFPKKNGLTLAPRDHREPYAQGFSSAYMLREPAGDYHFVLVEDGTRRAQPDSNPAKPLQPEPSTPLRQVVHVHVFWKPMRGAKPDNPSSTNAAIDWYFVSNHGTENESTVHYRGAGFVKVSASKRNAVVEVRSAALVPAGESGEMRDPFGPSHVSGRFVAERDPGQVRDVLAEVNERLSDAAATTQATTDARR